jgi:hypothetical protein
MACTTPLPAPMSPCVWMDNVRSSLSLALVVNELCHRTTRKRGERKEVGTYWRGNERAVMGKGLRKRKEGAVEKKVNARWRVPMALAPTLHVALTATGTWRPLPAVTTTATILPHQQQTAAPTNQIQRQLAAGPTLAAVKFFFPRCKCSPHLIIDYCIGGCKCQSVRRSK